MDRISKGTQILAIGGLWTVTGCGNGRYTIQGINSKVKHSMPCADLHAELKDGKAFIANSSAYSRHETARGFHNVLRNAQEIGAIHSGISQ